MLTKVKVTQLFCLVTLVTQRISLEEGNRCGLISKFFFCGELSLLESVLARALKPAVKQ